jgi:hypothetical protein
VRAAMASIRGVSWLSLPVKRERRGVAHAAHGGWRMERVGAKAAGAGPDLAWRHSVLGRSGAGMIAVG